MKHKTHVTVANRMSGLRTAVMLHYKTTRDPAAEIIHSESLSFISKIFTDYSNNHKLIFFPTDNVRIAFSTAFLALKSNPPRISLRSIPFVSCMAAMDYSGRYLTLLGSSESTLPGM